MIPPLFYENFFMKDFREKAEISTLSFQDNVPSFPIIVHTLLMLEIPLSNDYLP